MRIHLVRSAGGTVPSRQTTGESEKPIDWTLNPQPPGFYGVEAVLSRDAQTDPHQTHFVRRDGLPLRQSPTRGNSAGRSNGPEDMTALKELAEIASQSGINWLKYPLWNSVSEGNSGVALANLRVF